jgi:hypothetical protein
MGSNDRHVGDGGDGFGRVECGHAQVWQSRSASTQPATVSGGAHSSRSAGKDWSR